MHQADGITVKCATVFIAETDRESTELEEETRKKFIPMAPPITAPHNISVGLRVTRSKLVHRLFQTQPQRPQGSRRP